MPELPEVEIVRRQLEKRVLDKNIEQVQVFTKKITRGDKDFARFLVGKTLTKIDRIGKLLIFATSDPDIFLLAHLRMTGKFFWHEDTTPYDKHTHLVISFEDGSELSFNDVRKFGYVLRANKDEVEQVKSKFGIEPLTREFTLENFKKIFKNRRKNIKSLLLDQLLIAGLGNIYVDEVLFYAGVLPTRLVDSITEKELKGIYTASKDVIRRAIDKGGTTFIDFAHTDGKPGSFVDDLQVFSRAGEACFRCGKEIQKTRVAGRGTHFCPHCQR